MKFRPKANRGFTLLEVMISSAIVAIGIIATLSLLTKIVIVNSIEQERARAHQIIAETLEKEKGQLFTFLGPSSNVVIWDNGTEDDTSDDTEGVLSVIYRDKDGNTIADALSMPTNPIEYVTLEVSLTWNPRGRMASRAQRETLMAYITP